MTMTMTLAMVMVMMIMAYPPQRELNNSWPSASNSILVHTETQTKVRQLAQYICR